MKGRHERAHALAVLAALASLAAPACSSADATSDTNPLRPGYITTVVGSGDRATDPVDGDADNQVDPPIAALRAHLDTPIDTAVDGKGKLFVIDWNGHKVRALQGGKLAFVAGTGVEGDACEGALVDGKCPKTSAELNHPTDIHFDANDGMYVAAWHNAKLKRVDLLAGLLDNVCGTGNRKFEGDGGPCRDTTGKDLVSFDLPSSVEIDAHGNLLISDQSNQVIRRLGSDGIIKSVAGNCPGTLGFGCATGRGYTGDGGPATLAHLNNDLGQGTDPQGKIALDKQGNLYIADTGNNVIRKVSPGSDGILGDGDPNEEIITTVAGTGSAGYSGDGGPAVQAELSSPSDVAVTDDGTLYIADRANDCVRRVDPQGTITTIAGQCGHGGFSGDGGPANRAALRAPYGISLAGDKLYIADSRNNRVRLVLLEK